MTPRRQSLTAFRRQLKVMPELARTELAVALHEIVAVIRPAMQVLTPYRTGKLFRQIGSEVDNSRLKARVGLKRRKSKGRAFYGAILDGGRAAQTVQVTRRRRGVVQRYAMRVRGLRSMNITGRAIAETQGEVTTHLNAVWGAIVARSRSQAGL